jgi:hypothetical protein
MALVNAHTAALGKQQTASRAAEATRERRRSRLRIVWFALLMAAICLEGLGRRYVRQLPPTAFYFMKDVVLVLGLGLGISPEVKAVMKRLYGRASIFLVLGIFWSAFQIFNPEQASYPLGLVGLRSYWLWWLAPVLIASVLMDPAARKGAIIILAVVSGLVCFFAVTQFAAPPEAEINVYSVTPEGVPILASQVASTGRTRVASTFSFITGFSDFTIIIPPLLLAMCLGASDPKVRLIGMVGVAMTAAVLPMSGSRAPLLIAAGLLIVIVWSAGFLFTRAGRRVVFGSLLAAIAAMTAFPDALQGVYDRLGGEDTNRRIDEVLSILPPVSLTLYDYPFMGIGVGMQHNARSQFFTGTSDYGAEYESAKQLIELGVPGYLLCWLARVGISIALFRASFILRRAGRGAAAGAAVGFAALTFFGSIVFDHIWQALFFTAAGYVLAETTLAQRSLQAAAARNVTRVTSPLWKRRRIDAA